MAVSDRYRRTIAQSEGERFWALYGFTAPDDLVLEDLALHRGVLVVPRPLKSMEACLLRDGKKGLIRIRQDIRETGRKRFAVAHELGHWELHKDISQVFACTDDDMVASYKASREEGEANGFAAGLLMPSALFSATVEKPFNFDTLTQTADYFHTSLTATAIRYVELSSDYCAVAVIEAGKIRWWRGSQDFEQRFWLRHGASISRDTMAASLSGAGQVHAGPEEVDIEAWSERGSDEDSQAFIEESLHAKHYGYVITLLQLP